jgi:hypothetical protein
MPRNQSFVYSGIRKRDLRSRILEVSFVTVSSNKTNFNLLFHKKLFILYFDNYFHVVVFFCSLLLNSPYGAKKKTPSQKLASSSFMRFTEYLHTQNKHPLLHTNSKYSKISKRKGKYYIYRMLPTTFNSNPVGCKKYGNQ